jgi:hypothetical protein
MSAFGVKRTWRFALHMSAFDPKRTWGLDQSLNLVVRHFSFAAVVICYYLALRG